MLAGLDDRRARLGHRAARRGPSWTASSGTARRPGSGSATATSRRTSSRTDRLRAGDRPTDVALRAPARARHRRPRSCRWPTSRSGPQVRTDDGWLDFQEYFVHRHQAPDGPRGPLRRHRGGPADAPRSAPRSTRPTSSSSRRRTRSCRSGRSWRCPGWRERIDGARARGVPVVAVSGDRRRQGAEGPGRPDARLARPRVERARASPGSTPICIDVLRPRQPSTPSSSPAIAALGAADRSSPTRSWPTHARPRPPVARRRSPRLRRVATIASVTSAAARPRGSRRSSRSGRSRAPRRGSAARSTPRSATTSSTGCWRGPWRPPWRVERLADVVVVSPDREVLRLAAEPGARDAAPAQQRPQRGPARGTCRRRGRRRRRRPDRADRPAVRHGRGDRTSSSTALVADRPAVVARHRPPRDRDERPRPATARRHRLRVRAGQPGRASRAAVAAPAPSYVEVDGPLAVDLDTPDDLVLIESTSPERPGVVDRCRLTSVDAAGVDLESSPSTGIPEVRPRRRPAPRSSATPSSGRRAPCPLARRRRPRRDAEDRVQGRGRDRRPRHASSRGPRRSSSPSATTATRARSRSSCARPGGSSA